MVSIGLALGRLRAVIMGVLAGAWGASGFTTSETWAMPHAALGVITGLVVFLALGMFEEWKAGRRLAHQAAGRARQVVAEERLRMATRARYAPAPPQEPPTLRLVPARARRPWWRPLLAPAIALVLLGALDGVAHAARFAPVPTVKIFPRPTLSIAQARWFVEREAAKWPMSRARGMQCWRLSPATVACSFWSRSGVTRAVQRTQPPRKTTEVVEYTGAPIRMWLAGEHRLTPAEVKLACEMGYFECSPPAPRAAPAAAAPATFDLTGPTDEQPTAAELREAEEGPDEDPGSEPPDTGEEVTTPAEPG